MDQTTNHSDALELTSSNPFATWVADQAAKTNVTFGGIGNWQLNIRSNQA